MKTESHDQWEYTFRIGSTLLELNELGSQGWELCSVDTAYIGTRFYFKRRLEGVPAIIPRKESINEG